MLKRFLRWLRDSEERGEEVSSSGFSKLPYDTKGGGLEAIIERGRRDGMLEQPKTVSESGLPIILYPVVAQFEERIEDVDDECEEKIDSAMKSLDGLDGRIFEDGGGAEMGETVEDSRSLHDYKVAMKRVVDDGNRNIQKNMQLVLDRKSLWGKFCAKHGLRLVLEHEVQLWQDRGKEGTGWAWLVWAWAAEAVVNGVFFVMQNPDGGWIPVALPALLFGAINMFGFVLVIGTMWRYREWYDIFRRRMAWAGLALFSLLCLLFNLGVAHYRDAVAPDFPAEGDCYLGEGVNVPGVEASCLLGENGAVLAEWEAYAFFALGIIFVLIGVYKFVTRLYPGYPGYGRVIRSYILALADPEKAFRKVQENLDREYELWKGKFSSSIKNDWVKASKVIETIHTIHRKWVKHFRRIKKRCEEVVNVYIETNNAHRSPPKLPYPWTWNTEEPLVPEVSDLRPKTEVDAIHVKEQEYIDSNLTEYYERCKKDIQRPPVLIEETPPPV